MRCRSLLFFFLLAFSYLCYFSFIPVVSTRLSSPPCVQSRSPFTSCRGAQPIKSATGPERVRAPNPAAYVPSVPYTPPSLSLPLPAPHLRLDIVNKEHVKATLPIGDVTIKSSQKQDVITVLLGRCNKSPRIIRNKKKGLFYRIFQGPGTPGSPPHPPK